MIAGPTHKINQILNILNIEDDCSNKDTLPDIIIKMQVNEKINLNSGL